MTCELWIALAPTGLLTAIAFIRRTGIWVHALALSAGHGIASVVILYWDMYVRGDFDPKFGGSPKAPFELGLIGTGVFGALCAAAFMAGAGIGKRWLGAAPQRAYWPWSIAAGIGAAAGLRVLYALFRGTGTYGLAAWSWVAGFPIVYVLIFLALQRRRG